MNSSQRPGKEGPPIWFTEKETEAYRGQVTCLKSPSPTKAEAQIPSRTVFGVPVTGFLERDCNLG